MNITAFAETVQKDTRPEKIAEVITKVYKNKDINSNYDLSSYFTPDVLFFLNDKIEVERYVDELYGFERQNYTIMVTLKNKSMVENVMQLEYKVETTYNYSIFKDTTSIRSERVIILFDTSKNLIIDFFTPNSFYDRDSRNEDSISYYLDKTNSSPKFTFTNEIKNAKSKIINDIDTVYSVQMTPPDANKIPISTIAKRSGVGINRTAVVSYAKNNCHKATPSSGSTDISYVDFSELGTWYNPSYDCTNFVSHAILAGGAVRYDSGQSGITDNNRWYFRNTENRAKAWSSVQKLHEYLTTNNVSGTAAGIDDEYVNYDGYWATGYIIQITRPNNSNFSHSMIITKKEVIANRAYAFATGRTDDTVYNYDDAIEDLEPTQLKRVIYVLNNN